MSCLSSQSSLLLGLHARSCRSTNMQKTRASSMLSLCWSLCSSDQKGRPAGAATLQAMRPCRVTSATAFGVLKASIVGKLFVQVLSAASLLVRQCMLLIPPTAFGQSMSRSGDKACFLKSCFSCGRLL